MRIRSSLLGPITAAGGAMALFVSCGSNEREEPSDTVEQAVGQPSPDQMPLDPTTVPMFAQQLPIPRVFAPTVIKNQSGQVIRNEYTIHEGATTVQMLPPGFPKTTVFAFGGDVTIAGSSSTEFLRGTPGAVFENTRGTPTVVHWGVDVQIPMFLAVDPNIHFANPLTIEKQTPPFNLFPPGYAAAQFPIAHVTHTHGLMVPAQMDGTAEEWFTHNEQLRGPSFVTSDYTMPNDQPATQLFYHDHVMGETRLGIYAGEVGTAYMIRDPHTPLDGPSSPLPKGQFEIPLAVSSRAFFTDGEENFPPDRGTLTAGDDAPNNIPYWTYDEGSDIAIVNGAAWPNLNVQRHQYRFRMVAQGNTELWDFQLVNVATGAIVPFTIIGSDGGYLPAPQVVRDVQLGITERADILVDFSQFAAGTQLIMKNIRLDPGDTLSTIMRFTVQNSAVVHPPTLNPSLFPPRPVLTANAPARFKLLRTFDDLKVDDSCANQSENCNQRSLDGLDFTTPATEFPLIGSTEVWNLIHTGGGDDDDPDHRFHQIHIHLLEFQVVNRQPIDSAAYLEQWHLLNGHMPVTRPIVLDPTPFFTGPPVPPLPYETGWKDTVQAAPDMVNRIIVRWAPQETAAGGVSPGQNKFSIDPTLFPDPVTGPGYVWHCHIVGHEDHDMMRPLAVVNAWAANRSFQAGNVIAFNNIDYRARVAHTSSHQTPDTRFDLWARVNNNDGTWQPQIIYALNDRVLFNGQLYVALTVHQAQTGQTPANTPAVWRALPMTACGQLAQFCEGNSNPTAVACLGDGQAGNDGTCRAEIEPCLSICQPRQDTPCSGLCNNPVSFSVADGSAFQSGNLGTGAACFETTSRLLLGVSSGFNSSRQLTVNGRLQNLSGPWNYPLPPARHDGYCIQATAGNSSSASFTVF